MEDSTHHDPIFKLPERVEANASSASEILLPDSLIKKIIQYTNQYAKSRLTADMYEEVSEVEMLHFFAVYYYMGIVRLPARRDYWRGPSQIWPSHFIPSIISRTRFNYIWRNLHLSPLNEDTHADSDEDSVDEDEEEDDEDKEICIREKA